MIESFASGRERIWLSARAVLRALAGDVDTARVLDAIVPIQIFRAQIAEGRSIRTADFVCSDHFDDDWVVLELDGPDSAMTEFRVPGEYDDPEGSRRDSVVVVTQYG